MGGDAFVPVRGGRSLGSFVVEGASLVAIVIKEVVGWEWREKEGRRLMANV